MDPLERNNNDEPIGEREIAPETQVVPRRKRIEYPHVQNLELVEVAPERCEICGGKGTIKVPIAADSRRLDRQKCPACDGTGKTPKLKVLVFRIGAPHERIDFILNETNEAELTGALAASAGIDIADGADLHNELARYTGAQA